MVVEASGGSVPLLATLPITVLADDEPIVVEP